MNNKRTSYCYQVMKVDMVSETVSGAYVLDKEILPYNKRVTHITMYTRDGQAISFKNCKLFDTMKIDDRQVLPPGFDTSLLYPVAGSDCSLRQEVNITIQNGSRIKCRFTNPELATALVIVLQLEKI